MAAAKEQLGSRRTARILSLLLFLLLAAPAQAHGRLGNRAGENSAPSVCSCFASTHETLELQRGKATPRWYDASDDSFAPKTAPRTAGYKDLTAELKGTGEQANHLNQNAVYKGVIPEEQGLANGMRGNAFTEVGTPHYEFHRSLESFWNQYRPNGPLAGTRPTNAQYGQALEQALRAGGYSAEEAANLAAQAAQQRAAYGLGGTDLVPRIPGRINQTPPPPR